MGYLAGFENLGRQRLQVSRCLKTQPTGNLSLVEGGTHLGAAPSLLHRLRHSIKSFFPGGKGIDVLALFLERALLAVCSVVSVASPPLAKTSKVAELESCSKD